jgi:hypothetical protein
MFSASYQRYSDEGGTGGVGDGEKAGMGDGEKWFADFA